MSYAWIIDIDHDPCPEAASSTNLNAVGVVGPSSAPDELISRLKQRVNSADIHPFRLLDDDRNLCYSGRFYGDPRSVDGFAPLDDFGEPNNGCTVIQYLNDVNNWEDL